MDEAHKKFKSDQKRLKEEQKKQQLQKKQKKSQRLQSERERREQARREKEMAKWDQAVHDSIEELQSAVDKGMELDKEATSVDSGAVVCSHLPRPLDSALQRKLSGKGLEDSFGSSAKFQISRGYHSPQRGR